MTVANIAAVPALYVVITDDLDATQTGYLAYVDQSATMNGSPVGVSFTGTTITADYGQTYGNLEPGDLGGAVVLLLLGDLIDLRRAHRDPGLGDLARDVRLDPDVVRRVVAGRVSGREHRRELVEHVLVVGLG